MLPISIAFGLCAGSGPLTIDEAVDRAILRAPELRAAQFGEDAASERAEQARAAYWPRVSVDASYLARWPKNELPIDLSALPNLPGLPTVGDVDDIHHFNAGVQLGVVLFDLTRGEKVDALEHLASAERAKLTEAKAQLAFQTRAAFLAALFARDVAAISEASLAIAKEEEHRAAMRREVGTGTEVALAQARVRRASLEAQAKRSRHELARYTAQLASWIGAAEAIEVRGDLQVLSSTASLSAEALRDSPVLQRLAAMRASAMSSARAKSRSIVPTVSALGKAELAYPRNLTLEVGPVLSAGVNLSWVVFDGFLRTAGVAEAEAQASQLEESERAARETLERKLIELDARRKTASSDVESARESLEQAQVYVRAARAAVESGTGTELELTTAKNGIDQAQIAVSQALLAAALVEAERLLVYGVSK